MRLEKAWVELSPEEIATAEWLGRERQKLNELDPSYNTYAQKVAISDRSPTEMHIEGAASEIAFCKLHGLPPNLSTGPDRPTFDAIWPETGEKINIKATPYRTGCLVVPKEAKPWHCDLYALMVGYRPRYRFVGFAYSRDIIRECMRKKNRTGFPASLTPDCFVQHQSELWVKRPLLEQLALFG